MTLSVSMSFALSLTMCNLAGMTGTTPGARRPGRGGDRREATKARLLAAARRLFEHQGYEATSVTEIAGAVGVSHALINAYFNGKPGLLYAILTENNRAQIDRSAEAEATPGDVLDRLARLMAIWAEGDLREPRLTAVMLAYSWQWPAATEADNRAQLDAGFAPARRILARAVAGGELREGADVEALVEVLYAVYLQSLRPAVFDGAAPAECVAKARRLFGVVLDGVRAEG